MPLGDAIVAAVLIALLGGLHCVGMCGPLAVIAARSTAGRIPYVFGKAVTYAVLGLLAGLAGGLATSLLPVGRALAISVGVFLILSGVVWIVLGGGGSSLRPGGQSVLTRLSTALSNAASRVIRTERRGRSFALGAINGLFPCGLTLAAIAIAVSTSTASGGALVMLLFGLATGPSLLLAGLIYDRVEPARRVRWQRITGVVLIVAGVLTVMRGIAVMSHAAHG